MSQGELPQTRMESESGMSLLFSMSNGFARAVQTKTIDQFIDDNDIQAFSDFFSANISALDYVNFLIGFVICASVGVVLALAIPIAGCIVGCARCCKCCCACCGGREIHKKPGASKRKRYGCSGALLCVSTILLASVICSFIVTEMYRRELNPKTGALEDVNNCFVEVDNYLNSTVAEVNTTVVKGMNVTKFNVFDTIDRMPNETRDRLGNETNLLPPLNDIVLFVGNIHDLNASLNVMDSTKNDLQQKLDELSNQLVTSISSINNSLSQCTSSPGCDAIRDKLSELRTNVNFTNVTDLMPAIIVVTTAIENDVEIIVECALREFNSIANETESELSDNLNSVKDEIEEIEDNVIVLIGDLVSTVEDVDLSKISSAISEAKPYLDEYGHYVYAGLVSLNTLLLLIVVLQFSGSISGMICPNPLPDANCCDPSSIHSAKLLLASSGFTFIFSWIIVIITTALLVAAGLGHTIVCRHLLPYDSTMDPVENLIWNELNEPLHYNISIRHVMESCKNDSSFYEAVDAEKNGINITEILDLEQYGIYDVIDDIKKKNVSVRTLDIAAELNQTIFFLGPALSDINYVTYEDELNKPVTAVDLSEFAELLKATNVTDLELEAEKITNLNMTYIPTIKNLMQKLADALKISKFITGKSLNDIMNELAEGENCMNAKGDIIIKQQIANYSDEILHHITAFTSEVEDSMKSDVGNCRSLFDAGASMTYGACVYFLDPINAMWFCYGWFVVFSIPALILSIQLADIFREIAAPKEEETETPNMEMHDIHGEQEGYKLYYIPKNELPKSRTAKRNKVYPQGT